MDNEQLSRDDRSRYIEVCRSNNSITFRIQKGPIKENGVNGCQIDTIISVARQILMGLNKKFSSPENDRAIDHLGAALSALKERKADRENRGVEGFNKA